MFWTIVLLIVIATIVLAAIHAFGVKATRQAIEAQIAAEFRLVHDKIDRIIHRTKPNP